jgi:hypothetical protein
MRRNASQTIPTFALQSKTTPHMKILGIPGTSFSPRRALGIDVLKRNIARATGIPLTKQGLERKIGRSIIKEVGKIIGR